MAKQRKESRILSATETYDLTTIIKECAGGEHTVGDILDIASKSIDGVNRNHVQRIANAHGVTLKRSGKSTEDRLRVAVDTVIACCEALDIEPADYVQAVVDEMAVEA